MNISHDEARELRALQEKAYSRDGGLTDTDAGRLRELEELRHGGASTDAPPVSSAAHPEATEPSARHRISPPSPDLSEEMPEGRRAVRVDPAETSPSDSLADTRAVVERAEGEPEHGEAEHGDVARQADASARSILLRFWRPVAASVVLLLAIGVGAGWLLFGRGASDDVPLTREQEQRRLELTLAGKDGSKYDEGSVRAVGTDDDALVWYATRRDGELACIILDLGERSSEVCDTEETVRENGVSVSALELEDGGRTVFASILYSTGDEPVAVIRRWDEEESQLGQLPPEHRERAGELQQAGYLFPAIVGFLRDQPVWTATRPGGDVGELCLLPDAAAGGELSCAPLMDAYDSGLTSSVVLDDGTAWLLELKYGEWQQPYLTITQASSVSLHVESGEVLEIGGERGDPIEVTPEAPKG